MQTRQLRLSPIIGRVKKPRPISLHSLLVMLHVTMHHTAEIFQ